MKTVLISTALTLLMATGACAQVSAIASIMGEAEVASAPEFIPDGYTALDATTASAESLRGVPVYTESSIKLGSISDVTVSEDGVITDIIMDDGIRMVSIPFTTVLLISKVETGKVNAYVGVTITEVEEMPDYIAPVK